MLKKLFSIVCATLVAGILLAQEQNVRPQRTPEEEASKQTERLVRELGIKDSVRIDTIYRMHLKYARIRQKGLTRAENMERMQSIYNELKQLLTPDEFERFMNHPAEQPRRPRGANVVQQKATPSGEDPNKPTLREELRQADQP
jgi:hypothetical protein